jgi:hypothetical protein
MGPPRGSLARGAPSRSSPFTPPPGGLLETALVYAYLFENEGTPRYAERAKEILLAYGDYRSAFPDWAAKKRPDYDHGVPALPDFFVVMRYLRAYDALHRLKAVAGGGQAIEEMVGHSIDYLLQTSEGHDEPDGPAREFLRGP